MRSFPRSPLVLAALGLGCVAGLLPSGCRPSPPPDPTDAVAIVAGIPIRPHELQAELQRRFPALDRNLPAEEIRQTVLDELIRQKALLHRARAQGLDQDPETRRRIELLITSIYLEKSGPNPDSLPLPTDEELRTAYEQSGTEFATPERFRVALIEWRRSPKATAEKDLELRQETERIAAELAAKNSDPTAFADTARRHSSDRTSRYQGGDVGWVELERKAHPWPSPVVEAISRLKSAGDLSPIVETPTGFYLLKLLAHQAPSTKPLTAVRSELVHRLVRDRKASQAETFEKDLRAGITIEIHPEMLERVPVPETRMAQSSPPSSPTRTRR